MCVHVPPKSLCDSLARGNPTPCFMGQPVGLEERSGQYRLEKKSLGSLEERNQLPTPVFPGPACPCAHPFTQHNAPYSPAAQHSSHRHRGSSPSRPHAHLHPVWQGGSSLLLQELRGNWRGIFQPLAFPSP